MQFGAQIADSQIESHIYPNQIKSQSHSFKLNLLTVKSNCNMHQFAIYIKLQFDFAHQCKFHMQVWSKWLTQKPNRQCSCYAYQAQPLNHSWHHLHRHALPVAFQGLDSVLRWRWQYRRTSGQTRHFPHISSPIGSKTHNSMQWDDCGVNEIIGFWVYHKRCCCQGSDTWAIPKNPLKKPSKNPAPNLKVSLCLQLLTTKK